MQAGPVIIVYPEDAFYSHVKPANVKEIVENICKGRVVRRRMSKGDQTIL